MTGPAPTFTTVGPRTEPNGAEALVSQPSSGSKATPSHEGSYRGYDYPDVHSTAGSALAWGDELR